MFAFRRLSLANPLCPRAPKRLWQTDPNDDLAGVRVVKKVRKIFVGQLKN